MPSPAIVMSDTIATFCTGVGIEYDSLDRLLWDEFSLALDDLASAKATRPGSVSGTTSALRAAPWRVAVLDDVSGALTAGIIRVLELRVPVEHSGTPPATATQSAAQPDAATQSTAQPDALQPNATQQSAGYPDALQSTPDRTGNADRDAAPLDAAQPGMNWQIATWQDSYAARQRLRRELGQTNSSSTSASTPASTPQGDYSVDVTIAPNLAAAVRSADFVIARLPKSLDALDDVAWTIATQAQNNVTVLLGGRVKHMTAAMNDVLQRHFLHVQAHHGRQKSRVIQATEVAADGHAAIPGETRPPTVSQVEVPSSDEPLSVASHGGVFGGSRLDIGTRELLVHLEDAIAPWRSRMNVRVLDLGCGNGILATAVARALPNAIVYATDDSAVAVESALATARLNSIATRRANADVSRVRPPDDTGTRHLAPPATYLGDHPDSDSAFDQAHDTNTDASPSIVGLWDDSAASIPAASIDLIVCNPPFHQGAAVDTTVALEFFAAAGRLLRPGGQMWTIFNRHLPYLPVLRRDVGPTTVVRATPKFTLARSEQRTDSPARLARLMG